MSLCVYAIRGVYDALFICRRRCVKAHPRRFSDDGVISFQLRLDKFTIHHSLPNGFIVENLNSRFIPTIERARTLFHDTQRDTSARVASDVVAAGSQAFHLACYHKNSLLPLRFSAEY